MYHHQIARLVPSPTCCHAAGYQFRWLVHVSHTLEIKQRLEGLLNYSVCTRTQEAKSPRVRQEGPAGQNIRKIYS
jgi:Cu2+-containing amine oxidase